MAGLGDQQAADKSRTQRIASAERHRLCGLTDRTDPHRALHVPRDERLSDNRTPLHRAQGRGKDIEQQTTYEGRVSHRDCAERRDGKRQPEPPT